MERLPFFTFSSIQGYVSKFSNELLSDSFSQCLHCWSKLRVEAAAFVLIFAFFPLITQFVIKQLGFSSCILISARMPPQQLWPMTKMFSTSSVLTENCSAACVSDGPFSKGITKFAIFRTRNASPGWKPKTFEGQTLESLEIEHQKDAENVLNFSYMYSI